MRMPPAAKCLTLSGLLGAGLLGGCAHQVQPTVAPDPFGYMKRSAVCAVGPVANTASGLLVAMKTRSDDGLCAIRLAAPDGGAYASFLLSTLPMHGTSFIYNYDGHTVVTYTAATAYSGNDSFRVSLVRKDGGPRVPLEVDVAIDATGVTPPPPPPPPPPPVEKPVHHRVRRHVVHHTHHVARKHAKPAQ